MAPQELQHSQLRACCCMLLAAHACDAPNACPLFQVADVHGDFDSAIDLDHEEAFRSVVVMRRLTEA